MVADVPMPPGIALLAVGLSATALGSTPLPMSLSPFGLTGCNLLQDTAVALALPTDPAVAGTAQAHLPIPLLPWLAGYRLFAQAWAMAPGVNAAGLIVSDGLDFVIGG